MHSGFLLYIPRTNNFSVPMSINSCIIRWKKKKKESIPICMQNINNYAKIVLFITVVSRKVSSFNYN